MITTLLVRHDARVGQTGLGSGIAKRGRKCALILWGVYMSVGRFALLLLEREEAGGRCERDGDTWRG